jgi:hypothetical protein
MLPSRVSKLYVLVFFLFCVDNSVLACSLESWSRVQDSGSNLAATANARYVGSCGLESRLEGVDSAYVEDLSPGLLGEAVREYRARFYLFISNLQMDSADSLTIFSGYNISQSPVFQIRLTKQADIHMLKIEAFDDQGQLQIANSEGVLLRPGWRAIELVWTAADGSAANTGSMDLLIDGNTVVGSITSLDNDTHSLGSVRIGSVSGNSNTVTGQLDFDAFKSQRTQLIGLLPKDCGTASDIVLSNATFLPGSSDCIASNSIQLGSRVTIDSGTIMNIHAPAVRLISGMSILEGAHVTIGP